MSFVPRPDVLPALLPAPVGDPLSLVPQGRASHGPVPRTVDVLAIAPRGQVRLTLSMRTATEAACGAVRDAIGTLGAAGPPGTVTISGVDRYAVADRPRAPGQPGFPIADAAAPGERNARQPARGTVESPSMRDAVFTALATYAHGLHRDGASLPAALAALANAVDEAAAHEAAGLLSVAALAAVHRDAAQCCRATFAA